MRVGPITRKATVYVSAVSMIAAISIIPVMAKPAMAEDACSPETIAPVDGSHAAYMYKVDTDCTLHIGPVQLPDYRPIQQFVKRIVFDDPKNTKLPEYSYAFFSTYGNLESIDGINDLDVSNVRSFDSMFKGMDPKNVIDISSWDTSGAESVQSMFAESNLDKFKGIENFKFNGNPSVLNFQSMFYNARSENGIHLSNWSIGKTTEINAANMFDNTDTNVIDIGGFANAPITDTSYMFNNVHAKLENVDNMNTSQLEIAPAMFRLTRPTNDIDLSKWKTSSLAMTDSMFLGSDISKFKGMDHWSTDLTRHRIYNDEMYAELNPSQPVRLSIPMLTNYKIFNRTNIDNFPDVTYMHIPDGQNLNTLFTGSISKYLDMSKWTLESKNIQNKGMLASLDLDYLRFNPNMDYDPETFVDMDLMTNTKTNVWDYLHTDESTKKWASLPIKKGCADQFNGDPKALPSECWDNSRYWISSSTGANADQEMLNKAKAEPDRIFLRAKIIPLSFNANGVENATNMPDIKYILWPSSADNDRIPNTVPKDPSNTKVFDSWNTSADGSGTVYHPGDYAGHDIQSLDLYAQWKDNNRSIKFIDPSNEGENLPTSTSIVNGNDYKIPDQTPTRKGYNFDGWAVMNGGEAKYRPGDSINVTSDLELYAVWSKKAPSVVFDNNGGNGSAPEVKPSDDDEQVLIDCNHTPSLDGATFIGWSKTKNDVLEGPEAGEKGKIAVCGYSGKKTLTGLQGRTIDLYAAWARNPKAVFNENRPKDMTALLPETKTITGEWYFDDSTPKTYVAPNIEGWYKGYTPDGVYQFDGWVNEDDSPFTGTYLERNDVTINAKWSKIESADVPSDDNDHNTNDNEQDLNQNPENDTNDEKPNDDSNVNDGNESDNNATNDNHVSEDAKPSHTNTPIPQESLILNNQPRIDNMVTGQQNESDIVNSSKGPTNDSDHDDSLAKTGVDLGLVIMTLVMMTIGLILNRVSSKLRH